jgi:hypothetical protein
VIERTGSGGSAAHALTPRFGSATLRMLAGFLIWAAHFGIVYVFTALVCARDARTGATDASMIAVGIAAVTAVAIAAIATVLHHALQGAWYRQAREAHMPFLAWLTAAVAAYALLAVLWTALPALWGADCRL